MERLRGQGVSPGVAVGRAAVWRTRPVPAAPGGTFAGVEAELAGYRSAVGRVGADLRALGAEIAERAGTESAAILEAQSMIAEDPELAAAVERHIREDRLPAAEAVRRAGEAAAAQLAAIPDDYLRQRAADVLDVTRRLERALLPGAAGGPPNPGAGAVWCVDELLPSDLAGLDPARVRAVVSEQGGATSHAALLAKGLGLPAVFACEGLLARVHHGDAIAVDGEEGVVVLSPDAAAVASFEDRARAAAAEDRELQSLRAEPAVTACGRRRLTLAANVGGPAEAAAALARGAEGIGLFRTEFLFFDRADLPAESEQFEAYRSALETMRPRPVVLRTLDVGGDKPAPALSIPAESNPFLGWRGIRLWLDREDLALPQLRAMLRAARYGELRVMFPMVSTLDELVRARALLERARGELADAAGAVRVGIMVEVPAVAVFAEKFAPHVDFFSIGTNDLTQYALAADRGNPRVAPLYRSDHPAVLRLVEMTVAAARPRGVHVAVCGDAAADPELAPVWAGLGVDELSMPASAIPRVKRAIRAVTLADCEAAARRALARG